MKKLTVISNLFMSFPTYIIIWLYACMVEWIPNPDTRTVYKCLPCVLICDLLYFYNTENAVLVQVIIIK